MRVAAASARPNQRAAGFAFGTHLIVAGLLTWLVLMPAPNQARAEGALEWQKDGAFGQAGFTAHMETKSARAWVDIDGTETPDRKGRRGGSSSETKSAPVASSSSSEQAPRPSSKGTRVASIGRSEDYTPPKRSITGGGNVTWVANAGCLASNLRSAINYVAQNYGSITVNSTCRSRSHNRRVGGASRSYHLTGDAADFRVRGNVRSAAAYLRSAVGGLKHYGGGLFHIDNGPSRSF